MACPCKNKTNGSPANAPVAVAARKEAEAEKAADDPLACTDCLDKHLGAAAEYAKEAEEDTTRIEEYRRAVGHMVCAEDHARALGLKDFASRIRLARKAFQTSRKASDMEALLNENTTVGAIR